MTRSVKMFFGFVLGVSLGLLAHRFFADASWLSFIIENFAQPLGQIFLRIIFAAVVPLVFCSLVLGVYEMGDFKSLGRVGLKTLIYTLFASTISVLVGILLVRWLKPGVQLAQATDFDAQGLRSALGAQSSAILAQASNAKGATTSIVELIPVNPIATAARALEGEMLPLMVFALIFGAALLAVKADRPGDPLIRVLEGIRDVAMKIVDFAMALAPYGVAALTFSMVARFGWDILFSLSRYVGVVVLGLGIQQFLVFGLILWLFARRNIFKFMKDIREVIITAFSTASSNATLPVSLRVADQSLNLSKRVSSFVLTVGATANQNGTALFEGVTVLFLAQVFSVDLTLAQQVTVMALSIVAGVGTAGVPGGSLPLVVLVLQTVNIPPEGIGLVLGVDRFLDMCRTVLNVTGDLVAAVVVDASEEPSEGT